MTAGFDEFDIDIENREGELWLLPQGDLDIGSAPDFAEAATLAARSDAREIVVDLRGLQLMDSTGLKALVKLCLGPEAGRTSVVPGNEHVTQVLRISGLEAELRVKQV